MKDFTTVRGSRIRVVRDFTDLDRVVCLRCVSPGDVIGGVYQRGYFIDDDAAISCTHCGQIVAY